MNEETDVLVVLTIHYIKEAEQLCDRVAIVDAGEIIAIDSPTTLKSSLNGYVVLLNVEGLVADLHTRLDGCSWVARYATTDIVVRITVEHGDTRIIDLVRLANDAGVSITSVGIHKPNLETVFLSMTGATLKECEFDTPEDVDANDPQKLPVDPAEFPPRIGATGDGE